MSRRPVSLRVPRPLRDRRRRRLQAALAVAVLAVAAVATFLPSAGCATAGGIRPPPGTRRHAIRMETTGYDSGPESCGWKRNWYGRPVYAYGPMKGKPKKVGQTASGVQASRGTLAADTSHYPFGTVFYVPGYGYGVVQDRGGDIKGPNRLDLWFPSRSRALKWGRKKQKVYVWLPENAPPPGKTGKP